MTISERIAYFRRKAGLSQRELANLIGVDPSAVGHWERVGGSNPRDLERVVKVGLGLSMPEFYSLRRRREAA